MQTLVSFQRVTCDVKVLDVDEAMEVAGGKRKQDLLVSDDTGTARSVNSHILHLMSVVNSGHTNTYRCVYKANTLFHALTFSFILQTDTVGE